jgi:hypothetical protein
MRCIVLFLFLAPNQNRLRAGDPDWSKTAQERFPVNPDRRHRPAGDPCGAG